MRALLPFVFSFLPTAVLPCDLALVLAVDVSGSVDRREYRIQMDGLAAALGDGTVVDALIEAQARVTLIQWSGASRQRQTIPWRAVENADDVARFADEVANNPREWKNYSTAVGEAVGLALEVLREVEGCRRRVIDVSGDGVSNEGVLPQVHRPALSARGVTLNALAIETDDDDLTAWFFENLIHGDGAFVITANGFEDYPAQILRKLQREVTRQVSRGP
ncbi:DUF1194 domain-containing protein [Sulfitobacter albidus]|uniref:DUF1194 domain-containing protein n=1 Tax=Sulfitobacter albidus TaxID=2829501 RepID=A0A975JEC7_9RHOB|nr:DUF1194 domain-containing protein [Sulfitobacter albidus]QUJ76888.1 DUF1194 domain-containing protein [Sulfitobacter albidus]